MITIRSYSTRLSAELARIRLDAAGIEAQVVGVDFAMEGGTGGIQLQVPDEYRNQALALLDET
ncbi:hypothetical protein [Dyella sp. C9]|uniref:hypothetical protein n=1 Tax=Dyella sp. C9 TaxID=2202154 RepID=UPI000DEF4517|nr:hypothetical protein [Dyella sp. C9]